MSKLKVDQVVVVVERNPGEFIPSRSFSPVPTLRKETLFHFAKVVKAGTKNIEVEYLDRGNFSEHTMKNTDCLRFSKDENGVYKNRDLAYSPRLKIVPTFVIEFYESIDMENAQIKHHNTCEDKLFSMTGLISKNPRELGYWNYDRIKRLSEYEETLNKLEALKDAFKEEL